MAAAAAGAPISLITNDGRALALDAIDAHAVIEGPLAFTEVRLSFDNPESRTLEGTFRFVLPPRASLARLAMKIGTGWQEGEVVDKRRARVVYDDFLHRRQDPALLEASAPNEVTVRVFPIAPKAHKELIVAFSQEIDDDGSYRLPLAGLPVIHQLDVDVRANGRELVRLAQKDAAPPAEVHVAAPEPEVALRAAGFTALRVVVPTTGQRERLESAVLLIDTSASRALGLDEALTAAKAIVRRIAAEDPSARVAIAAFDQEVAPIYEGAASALPDPTIDALVARGALGASNVEAALTFAKEAAARVRAKRLILVTDGVATAGPVEAATLSASAKALGAVGVERIDTIAIGGVRDDALVRHFASLLPRGGVVVDPDHLDPLSLSAPPVDVSIEGASWSWPKRLVGAAPGAARTVYATLARGPVRVHLGDRELTLPMKSGTRGLVERSWAAAKVASLVEQSTTSGPSPTIEHEITRLSLEQRLIGPTTALIVLENEYDYARWQIDRRSLARLLTVEKGAIREYVRKPGAKPALGTDPFGRPATQQQQAGGLWGDMIGDAFGAGGLGLSGVGEGGGGRGEGIGLGPSGTIGHGAGTTQQPPSPPRTPSARPASVRLRQGSTTVSGGLAPEIVQRIVRQNFGRLRLCYEEGLRRDPSLRGRLSVRFTITTKGTTSNPTDAGSTLGDEKVVACMVRAFSNLSFPQPEGGSVTVTYPVLFTTDSSGAVNSPPRPPTPTALPKALPPADDSDGEFGPPPHTGTFAEVMSAIEAHQFERAFQSAAKWHAKEPGDVLALVALGEALEAAGDFTQAARAYGSIVDLYGARADLRRFAGGYLERVAQRAGSGSTPILKLAADTFAKAQADRPDHPSGHRELAIAYAKLGDYARAFDAIEHAFNAPWARPRFPGADRIFDEDLAILGAAWIHASPKDKDAVLLRLVERGLTPATEPSTRFVLSWETDANDVDFHIHDATGAHAYHAQRSLPSGGTLFADVTSGYGPECFAIPGAPRAAPYHLSAQYYSRGPMGFGMGKLEVMDFDGRGKLTFSERPFVVMVDRAFVDLGTVEPSR